MILWDEQMHLASEFKSKDEKLKKYLWDKYLSPEDTTKDKPFFSPKVDARFAKGLPADPIKDMGQTKEGRTVQKWAL
jgi:DNA polymerase III delta prime subunit